MAVPPRAKPFGSSRLHLDIDFSGGTRPALVTRLLAACLDDDKETVWSWSVARRLQALLAVALAGGENRTACHARCANPKCGQDMELELDLAGFAQETSDEPFEWSPDGATRLEIRLPAGADQRNWAWQQPDAMLATALVQRIDGRQRAPDWRLPADWLASLAAELERRDPLTVLELSAQCPACSADVGLEFDLEAFLLQLLARKQKMVMEQVHRLASAYHWPEAEILAIPAWRREFYLKRIDSGDWL